MQGQFGFPQLTALTSRSRIPDGGWSLPLPCNSSSLRAQDERSLWEYRWRQLKQLVAKATVLFPQVWLCWNPSLTVNKRLNLALALNKVLLHRRLLLWQKGSWEEPVVWFGLGSLFKKSFFSSSYVVGLCICFAVTGVLFISDKISHFAGKRGTAELVAVSWAQREYGIIAVSCFLSGAVPWQNLSCPSLSRLRLQWSHLGTCAGWTSPKSYDAKFPSTPGPTADQSSYKQLWSESGSKPTPSQMFSRSEKEPTAIAPKML